MVGACDCKFCHLLILSAQFSHLCLPLKLVLPHTAVGQLLTQSDSALINLAAFQWCAFVAPTLWNAKQQGWDLQETFKLKSCQFKWLLAGEGCALKHPSHGWVAAVLLL